MFSASSLIEQKIKALNPKTMDEELKQLILERSNSLKSIKVASEKVQYKRVSMLTGAAAIYYPGNMASGFIALDEPLEHYVSNKTTLEMQLEEIETRLLKLLESSHHDEKNQVQCAPAIKK